MPLPSRELPRIVLRDLHRLVESEDLGESLFATAARLSRTDEATRRWRALESLESQTKLGVRRFLDRSGLPVAPTNRLAASAGGIGAWGLRVIPESARVTAIRLGTKRYLPAFERLASYYADTCDAPFFDYVVEHERAIITFTELALARDRNALDGVMRLLERGAPTLE
jgi:hypothetical protein